MKLLETACAALQQMNKSGEVKKPVGIKLD
jgi:hypothetical protein